MNGAETCIGHRQEAYTSLLSFEADREPVFERLNTITSSTPFSPARHIDSQISNRSSFWLGAFGDAAEDGIVAHANRHSVQQPLALVT